MQAAFMSQDRRGISTPQCQRTEGEFIHFRQQEVSGKCRLETTRTYTAAKRQHLVVVFARIRLLPQTRDRSESGSMLSRHRANPANQTAMRPDFRRAAATRGLRERGQCEGLLGSVSSQFMVYSTSPSIFSEEFRLFFAVLCTCFA